jgi:integrase
MTFKRAAGDGSTRWYIRTTLAGIGPVKRSLGTTSKARATKLESMIETLHERGRLDLLNAWLDDELELEVLAEAYETSTLHELTERLTRKADEVTLRDAVDLALAHRAGDVKLSTLQRYTESLESFCGFCVCRQGVRNACEVRLLEVLDEDVIQAFKKKRLEEGRARQTVNKDLQGISILITYAVKKGWLEDRIPLKRYPAETRINYLEADEITTYLANLPADYHLLMKVLLGTGVRLGEAERLTAGAVRFQRKDGELIAARLQIRTGKTTESVRRPFVPLWLARELEAYIEQYGIAARTRLFRFKRRTVQKWHGRAVRNAGLQHYTIHDHRHTAAVSLARSGMPLPLLQRQLGHKDIQQTMQYAEFHPQYGDMGMYMDQVGRDVFGEKPDGSVPVPVPAPNREEADGA